MIKMHSKPPLLELTDIQAAATTDQLIVLFMPPDVDPHLTPRRANIIHVTLGDQGIIKHDNALNEFIYEIFELST